MPETTLNSSRGNPLGARCVCFVASFRDKLNIDENEKIVKLPYLVLATLIILTLGVAYLFYQSAINKDEARFRNEVDRIQTALNNQISLYTALLKSSRGFIEADGELTRSEFAKFIGNLELDKNYAGIQGIGFTKVFTPGDREDLISKMRSEGYGDFQLFPDTQRESYQAVLYLEPFSERNRRAIGYDMSTEANRRAAIERARDTGEASASNKVTLLQETENDAQAGFLIYLPVYTQTQLPPTVEERRNSLRGFVYSPFRAGDFIKEIQELSDAQNIAIEIYDGAVEPENLLGHTHDLSESSTAPQLNPDFLIQQNLKVAGREWTVRYKSLPGFSEQSSVSWSPVILICGVFFSFLIFGLTYWESSARAEIQSIAEELYESEKQKRRLLVNEQEARIAAEQANVAKDEFISVVSHELRTPLNSIAGWTRILRMNHLTPERRERALSKIEKSLRHQTDLVEELLDYSKMITEKSELQPKDFVFSHVFEEVLDEVKPQARKKDIKIIDNNRLNGQKICGDKEKVKIVINNLLSNAIKFTPEGGKIEAELDKDEKAIRLAVKDNGTGISPKFLPHVFERFTQADTSITRQHGGLGLGLAISKHIVKLHKGTIEAHSEGEGKGAVFVVKLPYRESNKAKEDSKS